MPHPVVTIYTKSKCSGCDRTKAELDLRGAPYTEVDIEQDATAYAYVTGTLGYSQAPVVVLENDHWSGLNPLKIKEHFGPRPATNYLNA